MTKLLIVFFAAISGIMAGLALSKRIALRERFFDELVRVIDRLISDIKFSQAKIEVIIGEYVSSSHNLSKNLAEYKQFLDGGELKLSRGVLTKREYRLVNEFFERLGALDLDTQIKELENRKAGFSEILEGAKTKNKKYGKALVKLGFLSGLLIGILLL